MNILLVEKNDLLRNKLGHYLQRYRHQVDSFFSFTDENSPLHVVGKRDNLEEIVSLAENYQVIVIDRESLGKNGYMFDSAVNLLLQEPYQGTLIATTTETTARAQHQFPEHKVRWLSKPYEGKELLGIIFKNDRQARK